IMHMVSGTFISFWEYTERFLLFRSCQLNGLASHSKLLQVEAGPMWQALLTEASFRIVWVSFLFSSYLYRL
ncbi:hypothetical protein, partial [Neobacillus sp. 19]|uniref:hypothetical protein n=1 Tax=Neobacillus sp. 19 TaxID=3394458 RepID=UPI003BF6BE5A